MSISVDSSSYATYLQQLQSSSKSNSSAQVQSGTDSRPPPPPADGDNPMMKDLTSALSELGIDVSSLTGSSDDDSDDSTTTSSTSSSSSSSSTSATSSSDAQSALQSFVQSLMETLHQQGASGSQTASSDGYGDSNPMKQDMQTLIAKLSSGSDSSDTSDSGVSSLQSKFNDLLSSLGASNSGASLSDFLGNFASKMPSGGSATGNLVNTTA